MGLFKRQRNRPPRRYSHHATKQRAPSRLPVRPGRVIAIAAAVVAVITLALVWGNHLKRASDRHRADMEAGIWTLDAETAVPRPVTVPDIRAKEIKPEGNVGDILIAGKHGGVMLPLLTDGVVNYRSAVAAEAGLAVATDAPSIAEDVARVQKRGLRVIGIFPVTCFSTPDTATLTYRRGLALSLLREFAEAGMDELLLIGLPAGKDTLDRQAVDFLTELGALLSDLPSPPAVGVALSLSAFAGEIDADGEILYAGELSPGRIAAACDYLALDLRDRTVEELEALLPRLPFAYVRHSLRMLVSADSDGAVGALLDHGFERVFEMRYTIASGNEDT